MKSELISKLNTQIAMIDTNAINDHIEQGDLEEWLWDWRIEMGALSFALFMRIFLLTKERNKR